MSSSAPKVPFHRLPLPAERLQNRLPRLQLGEQPSAQRRSTTFTPSTPGVWARVEPLWAAWPLRITKEEVAEMGVDLSKGQQVNVEDVLRRWDAVDFEEQGQESGNGLRLGSSTHRKKLEPVLLGVSSSTLRDSLPHLDVGDAVELCNGGEESTDATAHAARESLVDILSGRKILSSGGAGAEKEYGPWSTRYCGHQFGVWAGQLGDGRAISLLETESNEGGRQEIQLKGAGRTPFSRSADGLAVLRSGVREFLGCEAVAALGIPTTRSLALLTHEISSLPVLRENGAEPPSLLARIAPSFIRIGHFEALNPGKAARNMHQIYFGGNWLNQSEDADADKGPLGGQGNLEGLRDLTEWCIELMRTEGGAEGWVREVIKRNAEMVAGWQVYGYMHGVLNSDNISVLGLTIDYGPYAFMDVWDEGHICNHSDPSGLYSYRAQPSRVLWDLEKLVSALYPLIGYEAIHGVGSAKKGWSEGVTADDVEEWSGKGKEVMSGFEDKFYEVEREGERQGWMNRFGLKTHHSSDDRTVFYDFLTHLHTHSLDFHTSLRQLSSFRPSKTTDQEYVDSYLDSFLSATLARSANSSEKRSAAKRDLAKWLEKYAARVSSEEEKAAWSDTKVHVNGNVNGHGAQGAEALNGNASHEEGSEREEWEERREAAMRGVNPRFVLRQWVLEELIAKLEDSGVDNIVQGRKDLSKILEMSTHPFKPWGEDDPFSEDARLCGLGAKEMLGFQCSCSS